MNQRIYSGFDYSGFEWTEDAQGTWYKFNKTLKTADKLALTARNAEAKRLKREGYKVSLFSLGNQLLTKGGIGSGKPQIDLIFKGYGLNFSK